MGKNRVSSQGNYMGELQLVAILNIMGIIGLIENVSFVYKLEREESAKPNLGKECLRQRK